MHRLQHRSMITRYRGASVLLILSHLLLLAGVGTLMFGLAKHHLEWVWAGAGALATSIILAIAQWIVATRVRCPLCMTQVLAHKSCSRHRRAKSFLGSYRLRVAFAVLFRGSFRCPYCGEPTMMAVRTSRESRG